MLSTSWINFRWSFKPFPTVINEEKFGCNFRLSERKKNSRETQLSHVPLNDIQDGSYDTRLLFLRNWQINWNVSFSKVTYNAIKYIRSRFIRMLRWDWPIESFKIFRANAKEKNYFFFHSHGLMFSALIFSATHHPARLFNV